MVLVHIRKRSLQAWRSAILYHTNVKKIAEIRAGADRRGSAVEGRVGAEIGQRNPHDKQSGEHQAECPRAFRDGAFMVTGRT